MSDNTAMERAAQQAARTGGNAAAAAAVVLALIIRILRERQQAAQRTTQARTPGRSDAQAMVQRQLPELFPLLAESPHWRELVTVLERLRATGVDVEQFLGQARPLLLNEHAQAQARAAQAPAQTPTAAPNQTGQSSPASTAASAMSRREERGLRGLVRRARDRSGDRARAQDLAALGVLPSMEARAVLSAYSGVGITAANALIESRQWPQIALDINALGRAGGDPAGVLRHGHAVWAQQQARGLAGPDWPDTAVVGLGGALQHLAHQQAAPLPAQQATDQQADQQATGQQLGHAQPASLTPVFSDGLDGIDGLDTAAVAHQNGVAADAAVHVVDDEQEEALSTGQAQSTTASQGR